MIAAVVGVLYFLGIKDQEGAFWGFFAMFMILFFATGVGNASTFQMIPAIMRVEIPRLEPGMAPSRAAEAGRDGVGGDHRLHLGGRGLWRLLHPRKPMARRSPLTGGPSAALWGFMAFYVTCVALTWFFYTRRGGLLRDIERGGSLAASSRATGRIRKARQ